MDTGKQNKLDAQELVGHNLKAIRVRQGLSLRSLAEKSGLSINTLSMMENGKTSPSVSTLQQLALALEVPISTFFEHLNNEHDVVFCSFNHRPKISFGSTSWENLGTNLVGNAIQPYIVTLNPGMGSGDHAIVHTGYEFIFCLNGIIKYQIKEKEYIINSGDSLVFKANLPHSWINNGKDPAKLLLIFYPSDDKEKPEEHHFSTRTLKKEITMKIAFITDDGKTISQHFGRAPYYLVCTIDEGVISERELRSKMGHTHFVAQHEDSTEHDQGHGMGAGSHQKHVNMAETIADCKALICGGMGRGAYESMRRLDIQTIVTDLRDIEEAAKAFLDGKLIDHTELLH